MKDKLSFVFGVACIVGVMLSGAAIAYALYDRADHIQFDNGLLHARK